MVKHNNKRILIVDDEPLILKAYQEHLIGEGYDVSVAQDGQEGLKKAQDYKPDLILLDILMPKLNGIEVLQQLHADKELAKIPVIVLTNLVGGDSVNEAVKTGSLHYLIKSDHSLKEISSKIKNAI
ncbi:MAG: response regulator [bacterium]|nr:response regulator [bacterium]